MKIRFHPRTLIFFGTAAALLACGKEPTAANNSANSVSAAPATAATANTAAVSGSENVATNATTAGGALNADFLVGKWSAFGEDCKSTVEFHKDGTAVTPIGAAKWTLTGDKLLFVYADGPNQPASTIRALGTDRMEITRGSGQKETEKRC